MLRERDDAVLTTQEACHYLRISRPTYLKYLYVGRIKGAKVGKGWKVLKSELERFLKGELVANSTRAPEAHQVLEERSSETR